MPENETMLQASHVAKSFIDRLLSDRDRPGYHFAEPEGAGLPGDPNGAFYADGVYHLMYLYHRPGLGHCWGHISSLDLLHWRRHKDCLTPGGDVGGCFSGGAFVDDDGKAYLTFWDYVERDGCFGGIRLAVSEPPYDDWVTLPQYIVRCDVSSGVASLTDAGGIKEYISAADPSNIWKKDGVYFVQCGNLTVLNAFGWDADSEPRYRGDWVDLFASEDLVTWRHMHRFYSRREDNSWTDESEDDMCASFMPLPLSRDGGAQSGKYLQLFISHNRGCQYYTGEYDRASDLFVPETHGRMSWIDKTYFAPEALIDGCSRQIMWVWLRDNPEDNANAGWSGVFGLPRTLWLDAGDSTLRMAPVPELERLRYGAKTFDVSGMRNDASLTGFNGLSCELELKARVGGNGRFGLRVRTSDGGEEYTDIYYDGMTGELVMDTRNGTARGWPAREAAPFALRDGEELHMRVFVDGPVLEVFANDRQAICRRVFPEKSGCGVSLICSGTAETLSVSAWNMFPSNPY